MKHRIGTEVIRGTKLLKVGATSTAFFVPIILAAAYLNMGQGQPCSCGGNCPPTPVNFVVTDSTDGAIADETSWEGVASSDGLTVAFSSYANNLGAPDDGSLSNVFVHDVRSEETTWINGAGAWIAVDPALTADGNYAVFAAYDDFLFGSYGWAVFGADTTSTGSTPELLNFPDVSVDPQPTISGDGRYMAYRTANVTSGDTNGLDDIYIRDRQTNQVYPARRPFGSQYNVHAHSPELARDANRLVYQLGTQTIHFTAWLCVFGCPDETFAGTRPSISDDGTTIAYQVSDGGYDGIFVFDEATDTHQRVSIDAWGRPASAHCENPVISGDGRFVAFRCAEAMTSHGGTNQAYVRDLVARETRLASITSTGVPANEGATPTSLSYGGESLILESTSRNLGTITAGTKQVFRVPNSYWDKGDTCIPIAGGDTTCNGVDDDCNGQIDDGYPSPPPPTTCGVGACAAIGAWVCSAGVLTNTCQEGIPAADDADCDGLDDDCDGTVDEDYAVQVTNCGTDPCISSGVLVCEDGVEDDTCQPDPSCEDDTDLDGIPDAEDSCPLVHDLPPLSFVCADALPPVVVEPIPAVTNEPTALIRGTAAATGQLVILGAYGARTHPLTAGELFETRVLLRPNESNRIVVFAHHDTGPTEITELNVQHISNPGTDSLLGTVVDGGGQPIARVIVRGGGSADLTDNQGAFELKNIDGQTTILVQIAAKDYLSAAALTTPSSNPITLSMDRETTTEILVGPAAGTLTTSNGFQLVVPAGALAPGQEVKLSERSARPSLLEYVGPEAVDITPDQDFLQPVTLRIPNVAGLVPGQALLATGHDPNTGSGVIDLASVSDDGSFLEIQLTSVRGRSGPTLPAAYPYISYKTLIDSEQKWKVWGTYTTGTTAAQVRVNPKECGTVVAETIVGAFSTPDIELLSVCDTIDTIWAVTACFADFEVLYSVREDTYETGIRLKFSVMEWFPENGGPWYTFHEIFDVPLAVLRTMEPGIGGVRTGNTAPNCSGDCRDFWIAGCP